MLILRRSIPLLCFIALFLAAGCSHSRLPGSADRPSPTTAPAGPEQRVRIKPVFLVPTEVGSPDQTYAELFMRHLKWAQRRYRELLGGRDTFELACKLPLVLTGQHDRAYYFSTTDGGAEAAVLELFAHDRVDRFTCPFIYVVAFVGTGDWPGGGGRPINGGINTGGGILVLSADALKTAPNFQSTLQHELGHSFGLPHVDVYGYDMGTNNSLMSYNPGHHTKGFEPSPTPGGLIPEDYRALSYAKRVFPGFVRDPARDEPPGYTLRPMVFLGPMSLTGQRDYTGPPIVQ